MESRILRALQPVLMGCAVLTSIAGEARADLIVVPSGLEKVEGNLSNAFPFSTGTLSSPRYQQVYSSSDFGSSDGAWRITGIAVLALTILSASRVPGTLECHSFNELLCSFRILLIGDSY